MEQRADCSRKAVLRCCIPRVDTTTIYLPTEVAAGCLRNFTMAPIGVDPKGVSCVWRKRSYSVLSAVYVCMSLSSFLCMIQLGVFPLCIWFQPFVNKIGNVYLKRGHACVYVCASELSLSRRRVGWNTYTTPCETTLCQQTTD